MHALTIKHLHCTLLGSNHQLDHLIPKGLSQEWDHSIFLKDNFITNSHYQSLVSLVHIRRTPEASLGWQGQWDKPFTFITNTNIWVGDQFTMIYSRFFFQLIPGGADLLLNMTSVLHDESVFEEPDKFKPERYLTGDIALKKKRTIPFGIGE